MKKPTVMTVVGTRPEIIRLSRLIPKFDEEFNHVLIHTGQNYDPMLSDVFFEELRLRQPDEYLNIDHSSLGKTIGDLFVKFEEALTKYKPDGVFILGDTNSALVAILAKRMQIPVYHWEAGNRSFDENVPEETNRKLVDHAAHFNIPYSYPAEANLLSEGLSRDRILMSGSPMKEVLEYFNEDISKSSILTNKKLKENQYFVASFHRQENVDNHVRLKQIVETLHKVSANWNFPILVSTHPRTRAALSRIGLEKSCDGIEFHEPIGYFDYIRLQQSAYCTISDSGSISEESALLDIPAITIRKAIERPEAIQASTIQMCELDYQSMVDGINWARTSRSHQPPEEYQIPDASSRVLELVASTVMNYETWSGVEKVVNLK